MNSRCWVEVHPKTLLPIRIFRHRVDAVTSPAYDQYVREWPRKDAVEAIRKQVFARANGVCDKCGYILTWGSLHMHERKFKSHGGEVSLENCWALCYKCHNAGTDRSEHKGLQWGKNE